MKIKKLRQLSEMSQKELGEMLKVNPNTVSQWENGMRLPSIEKLRQMAEIFECSVDELIEGCI